MKLIAKTQFGLEEVLAIELNSIGAQNIKKLNRAVSFEGDLEMLYKANLHLRTAIQIILPIHNFFARNENDLYEMVRDHDWSNHFDSTNTFAVYGIGTSKTFTNTKFLALKTKDAIVDQFRDKTGKRPSIDTQSPDVKLVIHVRENEFTISLDSSGNLLYKRGYRQPGFPATLNEVLAAGMILLTGWKGDKPFIDPMCGSGTLCMEAALIATNTAPGLKRRSYGFQEWKNYDPILWNLLIKKARVTIKKTTVPIQGYDISKRAIDLAKKTALVSGLNRVIEFKERKFQLLTPEHNNGIMVSNPPYGNRIAQTDIEELYGMIGTQLKHHFSGYEAWLLSSNMEALKNVGLRPSKKIKLFNGSLECRFQKFELYKGSKKASKN